ncbi:MAG: protein-glutamate O-methyltransferase CheR [Deltaproteobacteria bacterium]|nr:protein-glutamate O-methyltransferase CheR [Deltaproteobacteria bacterium]
MIPKVALSDQTFRCLRDFIYELTGIYIQDTKKYFLENRLGRLMAESRIATFEDYLGRLKSQGNGALRQLYDAVTTNETYFFREPLQFDVFAKHVVPRVMERKRSIKVWSAACSTGEEPYTIAAVLRETAPAVKATIVGSDISEAVLDSARRGVYTSYAVRNVPPSYQQKYFRGDNGTYELEEGLRKSVTFANINLVDDRKVRSIRDVDVIFCRNALIYFDDKSKRKAVSLLYDALAPEGFLLVGTSESLHSVTRAFQPTVIDSVVLYRKAAS